jgi:hypothetical protein
MVKAQTLRVGKLEHRVARLLRVQFGRSSEKMDIVQLRLRGAHPDSRVQRRLASVTHFHSEDPAASCRIGVAIDVETTGLDRGTDRIIELVIQRFRSEARRRIV